MPDKEIDIDELEQALAPKRKRTGERNKLWVGFTIESAAADTLKEVFPEAGIDNQAGYVRQVVFNDLIARTRDNEMNGRSFTVWLDSLLRDFRRKRKKQS